MLPDTLSGVAAEAPSAPAPGAGDRHGLQSRPFASDGASLTGSE